MDDLFSEILLRLPPDDPACLVRAALVCKPWRHLLSDAGFLRRYRAFHRTPPMLGFLRNLDESNEHLAVFVPTSAFRPRDPGRWNWYALDSRHGRVLLHTYISGEEEDKPMELIVWDPMTAGLWGLRKPDVPHFHFNATVLCAAAGGGCDHSHCHGGPFLVAAACSCEKEEFTSACVYSSETGAWSAPVSLPLGFRVEMKPSALVGDALFFICDDGAIILEFDMGARVLSVIGPPALYDGEIVLMPAEDGRLGFAGVDGSSLYLWSRETEPNGVAACAQRRVIDIEMMLPVAATLHPTDVMGFAEGAGIIFVGTNAGVFMVELKSGQINKVCERGIYADYAVFPYTSFFIPDCASRTLPSPVRTQ